MNHSVKRRHQALHQTHHHYYLNISVEAANLSNWQIESNRKKIDSVARIESNRIETFLPELECSTTCQVKFQINKIAEVVSVFITCVHQVLLKLADFGLKYSKK